MRHTFYECVISRHDPYFLRSLIMPLFGTGRGRVDPFKTTERMVQEVVQDLCYSAAHSGSDMPDISIVLFSTFTKDHVILMRRLLGSFVKAKALRPLNDGVCPVVRDV